MALTSPKCLKNNSEVLNKETVLLIGDAKFLPNGLPDTYSLIDLFLPSGYSKVKDTLNTKVDTQTLANSRVTSSKITGHDPEIEFTIDVKRTDKVSNLITDKLADYKVGNAAEIVIWEIYDLVNPTYDNTNKVWTGTGFKVKQWVGGVVSDIFYNGGNDDEIVKRQIKVKPDGCLLTFDITDNSLAPLIAAYGLMKHWGNSGVWDNDNANKIIATTK